MRQRFPGAESTIQRPASLIVAVVLIGTMIGLGSAAASTAPAPEKGGDYSRLLHYIQTEDLQSPLVEFSRYDTPVDKIMNAENLSFLSNNQDLLNGIRSRLNSDQLEWRLGAASKRLMIVPEGRSEYADLFERYCRDVVDYVLSRTQLPNPYQSIATLSGPPGDHAVDKNEHITAYLVHNVADEYIEEYIFSSRSQEKKKIKIKLRNRVYSGVVGSYTSDLLIGDDHQYEFIRNPYTLWQNSAKNPLNVFIVPIEETLHIALRESTEKTIRTTLERTRPEKLQEVEAIIEECMAVEEAIVGGIVSHLLPEIYDRFLPNPPAEHAADVMHRDQFAKYRYLDRGIQVVSDLGLKTAIDLYRSDSERFKVLLDPKPQPSVASEPSEVMDDKATDTSA